MLQIEFYPESPTSALICDDDEASLLYDQYNKNYRKCRVQTLFTVFQFSTNPNSTIDADLSPPKMPRCTSSYTIGGPIHVVIGN
jgi:hypothetical protein